MARNGVRKSNILIVDDDPIARKLLETVLVAHGYDRPTAIEDPRDIQRKMHEEDIAVVLLDLNMPHISGQESLGMLNKEYPEVPVIVITAEESIDTAVECMKLGAFDFMTKPIEPNRLSVATRHALDYSVLRMEINALNSPKLDGELRNPEAFEAIVTRDDHMRELFRYIEAVSGSEQSVLITGESGTGKELLAGAVHAASLPGKPFVAVNVAGLDDTMFSDTLFGHVPGAFTGAGAEREGLAARAAGGTLFLDEIGDLSGQSQTKLLRLIQEHEYYPLGSDDPHRFRARVVAATNGDIEELVEQGRFRRDLYYRLLTHRIHIPPLRERPGDIGLLVDHFAGEAFRSLNTRPVSFPSDVRSVLRRYMFPGNVRELRSIVFDVTSRLVSGTSVDAITRELASRLGDRRENSQETTDRLLRCLGRFPTLKEVEEILITSAMKECGGNQSSAAKLVGLSQSTLSRKMKR